MSDDNKRVFIGDSARPKTAAPAHIEKGSNWPKAPAPSGVGSPGANTQPKAPPTTSESMPPPSSDD